MTATTTLPVVLKSGTHAGRPAANTVATGTLYAETDTGSIFQSDGANWNAWGDTALRAALMTTKGDLISRSSTAADRLAVGTDGQVLTADSAQTLGVKWATASAGSGGITQTYVGYNTAGGTTDALGGGSTKQIYKSFTLATAGFLASVDCYINGNSTNGQGVRSGIADDNSGVPGKLIAWNFVGNNSYMAWLNGTARWMASPVGVWLPAGTYWLVASGYNAVTFHYDASGGDYTSTIADTALQLDAVGAAPTNSTRKYSIRGTLLS